MEPSEVYGNSLFMQIIWMRLPDRSQGWETSNGKKKDYGYLILKGHFLSELSRHNALEIFFQVFSFKKACTSSACASSTPQELQLCCVRGWATSPTAALAPAPELPVSSERGQEH